MTVQARRENLIESRHELIPQVAAARHPLEVVPPVVVIRAIEASSGKRPFQPLEYRLVPDMHAESHLRLSAVTAKVALSD